MNKYITHGIDGYLFDENNADTFDFSDKTIERIRIASLNRVQRGCKL